MAGESNGTWIATSLGELGDFRNGANFSKKDYAPGFPIVNVKQLYRGRFAAVNDLLEVDREVIANPESLHLRYGDILFARSSVKASGAGQVAMVGPTCPADAIFSGFIIRFRITKPEVIAPEFLNYLLRAPLYRELLTRIASGTTISNLSQDTLGGLPVDLPPLPEQRAIASILGALDDKIELNRRMNATLESLARAIFKSWFVDFEPVRRKSEGRMVKSESPEHDLSPFTLPPSLFNLFPSTFQDSDLGKIPEGWEVGPLTELAAEERQAIAGGPFGSKLSRKHYTESGVPVIRGANMSGTSGWFNDDDFVFVSDEKAETLLTNMAKPGDVVFTQRGTLGQVALIPSDARFPRYVISQSQMKMTCADGVPGAFVYLYFTQPAVINYITGNATASGVPHINLTFLREFDVLIPPREVLAAFGEVIAPIITKLTANERESLTLSTLRDTLLPKLLSGEIRIVKGEDRRVKSDA